MKRLQALLSVIIVSSAMMLVPVASSATEVKVNPLTVRITNNGIPATSSEVGKIVLVDILLNDNKNIGLNQIAKPVTFSFTPMNSSIVPFSKIVALQAGGSRIAGGVSTPVYYGTTSYTPTTSGTLTINFVGDADYPAAIFTRYIDIWTPQARTTSDQVDQLKGFQVHAIYVVPSDVADAGRDTSGQISSWLLQGARWLDRETGDHWRYDTFNSVADVTYFRSSYPSSVLGDSSQGVALKVLKEMGNILPAGTNRKTYLLFVETPVFKAAVGDEAYYGEGLCGLADTNPSRSAIIATGNAPIISNCSGYNDIADWQAIVAIHETIHTFGVGHIAIPTDIMLKIPDNSEFITLDKTKTQYFGGSNAGVNIKTLSIWSTTPSLVKPWPCVFEQSNSLYLCKTGTTINVDAYPANCWQKANKTLVLQVKKGSKWITAPRPQISKAKTKIDATCNGEFPISYSMVLSSKKTGVYLYRFIARGWTGSSFSVIYQN